MARPRRRPNRSSTRRPTTWTQDITSVALTVAAQNLVQDITPNQVQQGYSPTATLRRLIATFELSNDGVGTEYFPLHVGMSVVTDDALGVGALPDPETDLDQDFYYWTYRKPKLNASEVGLAWTYDTKSMRRLREGYRMVVMMSHPIYEVTGRLDMGIRTLWSMP